MAEQMGYIFGMFFMAALILAIIGSIQFVRTGDFGAARNAALSWWAISTAIVMIVLGLVGQFIQNFG